MVVDFRHGFITKNRSEANQTCLNLSSPFLLMSPATARDKVPNAALPRAVVADTNFVGELDDKKIEAAMLEQKRSL